MSSAAASAGTEGDLGAIDEVKSFHHEGDGEENLSSLNDLKQDLEQEADTDKAKVKTMNKDDRLSVKRIVRIIIVICTILIEHI